MGNPYIFTVPAGLHRTEEIIALHRRLQSLGKDIRVQAYDTVQGLQWNGGRLLFNDAYIQDPNSFLRADMTVSRMREAVARARRLNEEGIGFNLVFNSTLESIDLDDEDGNELLGLLHHEMNGVTVSTESLRQHVRANFPNYEITASICFAYTRLEQYAAACRRYDRVVMMPTFAYLPEDLEGLELDKLVFIINDNCFLHCPRKDHYDYISRCNLSGNVTAQEQARNAKRGGCFLGDTAYRARILSELDPERTARIDEMRKAQLAADGLQSEDIEHNFTISPAARRELIQRGVRCFKLQGRDLVHSSFQAKVVDFLEKVVRDEL